VAKTELINKAIRDNLCQEQFDKNNRAFDR